MGKERTGSKAPVAKALSADDILQADDLELVQEAVPEWGGSVYLRTMPMDEGLVVNEQLQGLPPERKTDAMFLVLAACMAKPDGTPLFESFERAKAVLSKRKPTILLRLQQRALELQGWTGKADEKKGSSAALPVVSLTGSPSS